jgi:rubrerythrin
MPIAEALKARLLDYQRNEITEHHIYRRLADTVKEPENARVLAEIAADELRHYEEWKSHTGQDVAPRRFDVWRYYWISRVFGFTFGIKLMERGEGVAQANYQELSESVPEAERIAAHFSKNARAEIQISVRRRRSNRLLRRLAAL